MYMYKVEWKYNIFLDAFVTRASTDSPQERERLIQIHNGLHCKRAYILPDVIHVTHTAHSTRRKQNIWPRVNAVVVRRRGIYIEGTKPSTFKSTHTTTKEGLLKRVYTSCFFFVFFAGRFATPFWLIGTHRASTSLVYDDDDDDDNGSSRGCIHKRRAKERRSARAREGMKEKSGNDESIVRARSRNGPPFEALSRRRPYLLIPLIFSPVAELSLRAYTRTSKIIRR